MPAYCKPHRHKPSRLTISQIEPIDPFADYELQSCERDLVTLVQKWQGNNTVDGGEQLLHSIERNMRSSGPVVVLGRMNHDNK